MSLWTEHVKRWEDCQRCPLGLQRSRIVLARGAIPCDVLFLGEAPGVSEDAIGQPFVGPAGKLLDQIVAASLSSGTRSAFTNLVACFPREAKQTDNHQPEPSEIKACRDRLKEFVRLAEPRAIVLVGKLSAKWVTGDAMFCERDKGGDPPWLSPAGVGIKYAVIDHPAFILRQTEVARPMLIRRAVLRIRECVKRL